MKIVKALRTTGQANFPVPYVSRNNPALFALKPFEEFFFPPESTDIQRARAVFRVDWLTEAELVETYARRAGTRVGGKCRGSCPGRS